MNANASLRLVVAALVACCAVGCQSSTVYFSPEPRRGLEYVPASGGTPKVLVPEIAMVTGMACSADGGRIYTTQQSGICGWRADGTLEGLITRPTAADCVALDDQAGRIYWGDRGRNHLASCDLQGGNLRVLVHGVNYPDALAVNPKLGWLYWGQESLDRGVWMARLDGSGKRRISDDDAQVSALAVDRRSGKIFRASPELNATPSRIIATNFDGTEPKTIVTGTNRFIDGLAVDEPARRILWIERTGNDQTQKAPARIRSAKFDGTGVKTVYEFTGDGHARSVAVGPPRRK